MEPQQIIWDSRGKVLRNSQKELYVPDKRSSPLIVPCYGNPSTSHDLGAAQENATDRFKNIACKAEADAYEIVAIQLYTSEWAVELPDTYAAHAVGLLYGPQINTDKIQGVTRSARTYDLKFPQLIFDSIQQQLRTINGEEYNGTRSAVYVGHNNFGHSASELERNILGQLQLEAQKQNATGCEILSLLCSRSCKDEQKEYGVIALLYS